MNSVKKTRKHETWIDPRKQQKQLKTSKVVISRKIPMKGQTEVKIVKLGDILSTSKALWSVENLN